MMKNYGFGKYVSKNEPAVFYGMFCSSIPVVQAHRSFGVILWAGTDAQMLRDWRVHGREFPRCRQLDRLLQRSDLAHVCRSKQLRDDLEVCGIPSVFRRVSPVLEDQFTVRSLGSCVYSYGSDRNREKYGGDIVDELRVRFPGTEFLSHDPVNACVSYDKMAVVYERCFLGLRLTKHDGFPNSVLEMGLMGRPCVFNGDIPGSIPWSTVDDVEAAIRDRLFTVGCCGDVRLSDCVRDELRISDDWLDVSTYGDQ